MQIDAKRESAGPNAERFIEHTEVDEVTGAGKLLKKHAATEQCEYCGKGEWRDHTI